MKPLSVLFVGAHADDVEIGAGVLAHELVRQGHDVRFVVLSDDLGLRDVRRAEARCAAAVLGVPPEHVQFLGLHDGFVRAEGPAVGKLRRLLHDAGFAPDIVVTHSRSDSHNDHVEANRLAHAAVRSCVFLHFGVHLSLEPDGFRPDLYVGAAPEVWERKEAALGEHASQSGRIGRVPLSVLEADHGRCAGVGRAEAFETSRQCGAGQDVVRALSGLCASAFHRFWGEVAHGGDIRLVYGVARRGGSAIDWPWGAEDIGRDSLRDAFARRWYGGSLFEVSSGSPVAARALREDPTVVLVGGALSNGIVRDGYNRLAGVDWTVDFELPRRQPAYLVNRLTAERRTSTPTHDLALLSLRDNPYVDGGQILHVAGTSGSGTRAALEALARPEEHVDLVDEVVASRGRSVIAEFARESEDAGSLLLEDVLHV